MQSHCERQDFNATSEFLEMHDKLVEQILEQANEVESHTSSQDGFNNSNALDYVQDEYVYKNYFESLNAIKPKLECYSSPIAVEGAI